MIPLTIKHSKEDLVFFTMPKAMLLSLLDVEFKRLIKRECSIVDNWINKKKCKHITKEIINKILTLDCDCINKVLKEDKICIEADKKIERMTSALIYRNVRQASEVRNEN